jgi:hypothetical protein
MNHHPADDPLPRIEKLVRWTCRERIRFRWYLLRLTVREMNYAARRMTELHTRQVTSRPQQRTPGDDQARDPSCTGTQPGR